MKLCDSSVLIDIDRGNADDRVSSLDEEGHHAISIVSVTELHLGVHRQYERGTDAFEEATEALARLLARFDVHPVDGAVARAAAAFIARLRCAGIPLHDLHDLHDGYVAATAIVEQLPVLTANVDRFERIGDVGVVDWETY